MALRKISLIHLGQNFNDNGLKIGRAEDVNVSALFDGEECEKVYYSSKYVPVVKPRNIFNHIDDLKQYIINHGGEIIPFDEQVEEPINAGSGSDSGSDNDEQIEIETSEDLIQLSYNQDQYKIYLEIENINNIEINKTIPYFYIIVNDEASYMIWNTLPLSIEELNNQLLMIRQHNIDANIMIFDIKGNQVSNSINVQYTYPDYPSGGSGSGSGSGSSIKILEISSVETVKELTNQRELSITNNSAFEINYQLRLFKKDKKYLGNINNIQIFDKENNLINCIYHDSEIIIDNLILSEYSSTTFTIQNNDSNNVVLEYLIDIKNLSEDVYKTSQGQYGDIDVFANPNTYFNNSLYFEITNKTFSDSGGMYNENDFYVVNHNIPSEILTQGEFNPLYLYGLDGHEYVNQCYDNNSYIIMRQDGQSLPNVRYRLETDNYIYTNETEYSNTKKVKYYTARFNCINNQIYFQMGKFIPNELETKIRENIFNQRFYIK